MDYKIEKQGPISIGYWRHITYHVDLDDYKLPHEAVMDGRKRDFHIKPIKKWVPLFWFRCEPMDDRSLERRREMLAATRMLSYLNGGSKPFINRHERSIKVNDRLVSVHIVWDNE